MGPLDSEVVAAIIGAVAGVLATLGTVWVNRRTRKWELRDKRWQELFASLDRIDQLTADHIRAIGDVVTPLLRRGDFLATCDQYDAFVNDPKLPTGYGAARGVLEGASGSGQFRGTPVQEKLKEVIQLLYDFQQIGFLLKASSWAIAESMTDARDLWRQLESVDSYEKDSVGRLEKQVRDNFQKAFESLLGPDNPLTPEVPERLRTQDDVLQLIKQFCREWQRSAEMNLYGRRGLHHAIGDLRFALRST